MLIQTSKLFKLFIGLVCVYIFIIFNGGLLSCVYCRSGSVDIAELLVNCKLDTTPFTTRIFQLFDTDKSGQVDFHECVLSLWTFCTLGEDELVMFAYELYDMDGSGTMDKIEVQQILEDVYGKQFATNPMAKA